ncbi:MAG: superoxide dismutase family protein [Proteobacteria bacterium]|nr:superoxide dismutase family protein [Pseudomonadota bacterium]
MRGFVLSLTVAGLACAGSHTASAQPTGAPLVAPAQTAANGDLMGADGRVIGRVMLREGPTGVLISVEARGLKPGWHGMHFHEKGTCSDAGFKMSGGHMNHEPKRSHGLLSAGGPDFGDLPSLWVGADGSGHAQAFSTLVSLHGAGGRAALLDADGSALVIHADPDDQTTQPIGGAGARVACAVINAAGLVPAG